MTHPVVAEDIIVIVVAIQMQAIVLNNAHIQLIQQKIQQNHYYIHFAIYVFHRPTFNQHHPQLPLDVLLTKAPLQKIVNNLYLIGLL
jgi:hypothetical protein